MTYLSSTFKSQSESYFLSLVFPGFHPSPTPNCFLFCAPSHYKHLSYRFYNQYFSSGNRDHLMHLFSSSPGLTHVLEEASIDCLFQFYSTIQIQHRGTLLNKIKQTLEATHWIFFIFCFSSKCNRIRTYIVWLDYELQISAEHSGF